MRASQESNESILLPADAGQRQCPIVSVISHVMITTRVRQPGHIQLEPQREPGYRPKYEHEKQERESDDGRQVSYEAYK